MPKRYANGAVVRPVKHRSASRRGRKRKANSSKDVVDLTEKMNLCSTSTSRKGKKQKKITRPDPKTEYRVQKVMNKRFNEGQTEYLVRWKDYNVEDSSWEPKKYIYATNLVAGYERRVKKKTELSCYVLASDDNVARITGLSRREGTTHFIAEYNDGMSFTLPLQFVMDNLPLRLSEFLQKSRPYLVDPAIHGPDIGWQ